MTSSDRCRCGKRLLGKEQAKATAVRMSKRQGELVDAYKCPFDGKVWHVGHPGVGGPMGREAKREQLEAKLGDPAERAIKVRVEAGRFRFLTRDRGVLASIRDGAVARLAELDVEDGVG